MDVDRLVQVIGAEIDARVATAVATLQPVSTGAVDISLRNLQTMRKDVHAAAWGKPLPAMAPGWYDGAGHYATTEAGLRAMQKADEQRAKSSPAVARTKGTASTPVESMAQAVVSATRDYLQRNLQPLEARLRALEGKP